MPLIAGPVATVAVAAIYGIWRLYFAAALRRERLIRERVVYLLWSAAMAAD